MPGRIVLYGATGYIGGLTARAMVASGARPVLAGRDRGRLDAIAARLSQASGGAELEVAVAGTEGPEPLRQLLDPGDVLVSTAGPFVKIGRAAVAAAVDAGAIYLDSTGEPPFIRQVFEEFGPRAERTGAVLLTAFGYDYVPGNLAGALALEAAGPAAARGTGGLLRAREHAEGGKRRHPRIGSRGAARTRVLVPWRARRRRTDRRARRVVRDRRQQAAGVLHRLIRAFRAAQAPAPAAAHRRGCLPRPGRRRHRPRALRLGPRHALGAPQECPRGPGSAGPPDSAQPGHARRRADPPLRCRSRGGRRPWQAPCAGTPDRRGSVLVHRTRPRLGGEHGGRARRAARRRARPAEAFGLASLERSCAEAGFHRQ